MIAVAIGMIAVVVVSPGTKEASQRIRAQREAQLAGYRAEFDSQAAETLDPAAGSPRKRHASFRALQKQFHRSPLPLRRTMA